MEDLELRLSEVIASEEARLGNPIICNITNKKCVKCQPLCVNRQRQEEALKSDKQKKLERIRFLYAKKRDIDSEMEGLKKELNEIEDEENLSTFAN